MFVIFASGKESTLNFTQVFFRQSFCFPKHWRFPPTCNKVGVWEKQFGSLTCWCVDVGGFCQTIGLDIVIILDTHDDHCATVNYAFHICWNKARQHRVQVTTDQKRHEIMDRCYYSLFVVLRLHHQMLITHFSGAFWPVAEKTWPDEHLCVGNRPKHLHSIEKVCKTTWNLSFDQQKPLPTPWTSDMAWWAIALCTPNEKTRKSPLDSTSREWHSPHKFFCQGGAWNDWSPCDGLVLP